jgi:hypothetical protein
MGGASSARLCSGSPASDVKSGGVCMGLNREQLMKAVGNIDEAIVADILALGATTEELAEAQAWIANDEALINIGKPLVRGRVSRLVEILTSIEEQDDRDRT